MSSMFSDKIYSRMPLNIQETMISIRSKSRRFFFEKNFIAQLYREKLAENEFLEEKDLKELQFIRIQKIIKFAQKHVKYYKNLFRRIGFSYKDLTSLKVIEELPFLTKDILRDNSPDFLPDFPYRLFCIAGMTSGTSGTPLTIYHDLLAIMYERAFENRLRSWTGFKPLQRKVWLRGDLIVPIEQTDAPFWRFNRDENQLMMSSYHISEKTLPEYINKLFEFQPKLISAYPSSLFSIAKYMKEHSYDTIKLNGIVTSSETLYPEWRDIMEEMFCCRVFDWYGSYERVAAICSCEYGNYHIIEDYGFTELVDLSDGNSEIISTGFYNQCFPLIRYKTGDMVKVLSSDAYDCQCGRNFRRVESVMGRMNDYIVLENGRKFQGLGFLFKHSSILEGQIYQNKDYSIEIRIVPKKDFSGKDRQAIKNSALERFGSDAIVNIVCLSSLERTKCGKLKSIISEVDI